MPGEDPRHPRICAPGARRKDAASTSTAMVTMEPASRMRKGFTGGSFPDFVEAGWGFGGGFQ